VKSDAAPPYHRYCSLRVVVDGAPKVVRFDNKPERAQAVVYGIQQASAGLSANRYEPLPPFVTGDADRLFVSLDSVDCEARAADAATPVKCTLIRAGSNQVVSGDNARLLLAPFKELGLVKTADGVESFSATHLRCQGSLNRTLPASDPSQGVLSSFQCEWLEKGRTRLTTVDDGAATAQFLRAALAQAGAPIVNIPNAIGVQVAKLRCDRPAGAPATCSF
jgi:hypothetical protein